MPTSGNRLATGVCEKGAFHVKADAKLGARAPSPAKTAVTC